MATKTITLELDAYEKLRAAKRNKESFSSVVRRAVIPGLSKSGSEVVAYFKSAGPFFRGEELDAMEAAADNDPVASDPWAEEVSVSRS